MRSYRLHMNDKSGNCIASRVIDAETDFQAISIAEMLRGEFKGELFDRSRKVAELGANRGESHIASAG